MLLREHCGVTKHLMSAMSFWRTDPCSPHGVINYSCIREECWSFFLLLHTNTALSLSLQNVSNAFFFFSFLFLIFCWITECSVKLLISCRNYVYNRKGTWGLNASGTWMMGGRGFYLEVAFLNQTQVGSDLKLPQPNDCLVSTVKCVWWSQFNSW